MPQHTKIGLFVCQSDRGHPGQGAPGEAASACGGTGETVSPSRSLREPPESGRSTPPSSRHACHVGRPCLAADCRHVHAGAQWGPSPSASPGRSAPGSRPTPRVASRSWFPHRCSPADTGGRPTARPILPRRPGRVLGSLAVAVPGPSSLSHHPREPTSPDRVASRPGFGDYSGKRLLPCPDRTERSAPGKLGSRAGAGPRRPAGDPAAVTRPADGVRRVPPAPGGAHTAPSPSSTKISYQRGRPWPPAAAPFRAADTTHLSAR